jgi:hypothetical protein
MVIGQLVVIGSKQQHLESFDSHQSDYWVHEFPVINILIAVNESGAINAFTNALELSTWN